MCLLGPSGCGKTTALRLIAGLEVPDKGKITINNNVVSNNNNILKETPERGIGIVFQDLSLFPHLNLFENVSYALHEFGKEKMKERARDQRSYPLSEGERSAMRYIRSLGAPTTQCCPPVARRRRSQRHAHLRLCTGPPTARLAN